MKLTESRLSKIIKEEIDSMKKRDVLTLNEDNVEEVRGEIRTALQSMVPWSSVGISTLGGKHRPSIMFNISLDPKEEWKGGIYQNSRFAQFSFHHDGRVKCIAGGSRHEGWNFRSTKIKSVQDLLRKLQKFVDVGMQTDKD
jgi:hypothetical protein